MSARSPLHGIHTARVLHQDALPLRIAQHVVGTRHFRDLPPVLALSLALPLRWWAT